ncbi:MAG: DNA methyltransferase [Burkholderiales bacterium]
MKTPAWLRGIARDPQAPPARGAGAVPVYAGALWTARQRQASRLHEIAYRACFKAQLPAFFIGRLTRPGDRVYDPFSGRGTTALEAALHGRRVAANDASPLARLLVQPRLTVPALEAIEARLADIPWSRTSGAAPDLSMFYHRNTLRELLALRRYLALRARRQEEDDVDSWIRMVATNRLSGHSPGFFSVYTLPPNQAVSREDQRRINRRLHQRPDYRDVRALILRKSRVLQSGLTPAVRRRLRAAAADARFLTGPAAAVPDLRSGSVRLTVTSPPFLDVVNYAQDNWLRCWFNGLDAKQVGRGITMSRTVADWQAAMQPVFAEICRVTEPGGWLAFEVGEVRKGAIRLEDHVVPLGLAAGFRCEAVLINRQRFTKTANIWGVANNRLGTNSNRIVVFRKPAPA